ncbi:MAG: hypothetical protein MUF10_18450, partial [Thermoanaerobaculaceae bacterium]|nr:hypothetical protein [Thermoanaerobaculaceae bacterium]
VGTAGSGGGSCDISGAWRQPLGGEGSSSWTFTPLGGGRYSGREQGLGNVTGTAVVSGPSVRIDWVSPDGAYAGVNELTLDPACRVARGKVTFTRGRSDSVPLTLER